MRTDNKCSSVQTYIQEDMVSHAALETNQNYSFQCILFGTNQHKRVNVNALVYDRHVESPTWTRTTRSNP